MGFCPDYDSELQSFSAAEVLLNRQDWMKAFKKRCKKWSPGISGDLIV